MWKKLFLFWRQQWLSLSLLFLSAALILELAFWGAKAVISKLLLAFGRQLDSWINLNWLFTSCFPLFLALLFICWLCLRFLSGLLTFLTACLGREGNFWQKAKWSWQQQGLYNDLATLLNLLFFSFSWAFFLPTPILLRFSLANFALVHCQVSALGRLLFLLGWLFLAFFFYKLLLFYPFLLQDKGASWAWRQSWRRPKLTLLKNYLFFAAGLFLTDIILAAIMLVSIHLWPHLFWAVAFITIYQLLAVLELGLLLNFPLLFWQASFTKAAKAKIRYCFWAILLLFWLIANGNANRQYLTTRTNYRPLIIAHRGVNQNNAVPNSLLALKKTSRLHPDYVELDLHETRDGQFVVLHDESLRQLTGINKKPHDLTAAQITSLPIKAAAHRTYIANFSTYLRLAESLKQKLLIEIKTTPQDSPQMAQHFLKRYGSRTKQDHDLLQSLDYHFIDQIQKKDPQQKCWQLAAYNLVNQPVNRQGLAIEYGSLTPYLAWGLRQKRQSLFAWTVNSQSALRFCLCEHVQGIITDQTARLQKLLPQYQHVSYVELLANFFFAPLSLLDFT